jgi:septin family protein
VKASLTTKPYPEFNFRHKFSLLVVGSSQSGKTYFVEQILENNLIVYEDRSKDVSAFFDATINGKMVTMT